MSPALIAAIITGIDVLLETLSFSQAVERLSSGIAARAEKEGRDVTPEEIELIRVLRDEEIRRAEGGT